MKKAPGIAQALSLPYGPARRALRDPLAFWMDGFRAYGDVFRWDFGRSPIHLLAHPDHVQHVVQDHYKNYPHSRLYDYVKMVAGEGLLTSEGEAWRRDRRMIQPAFHHDRLAGFASLVTGLTEAMLGRWEAAADAGRPVDVTGEMARLTLAVISRALFSRDISADDALGRATVESLGYLNYRMSQPFAPPAWVPTPTNLRFRRSMAAMDRLVYGMIGERRLAPDRPDDLMTRMLAARDEESGHELTDRQVRDQVVTFIGAGHETTAVTLSWTWALLSQHPDVRSRLYAEVDAALGGRVPAFEDLPRLPYTGMVVQEALRLYPPVALFSRQAAGDDEIGGYHIPAKSLVLLSQYITHRHPACWDNPEGFDPERFAPERSKGRPKYAHFPFSGGPRKCIGDQFALMEARLVVATVARRFRLDLVPGERPEPALLFTLRPKSAIPMTLHRR